MNYGDDDGEPWPHGGLKPGHAGDFRPRSKRMTPSPAPTAINATCAPADPTRGGWHWLEHRNIFSRPILWVPAQSLPADGYWQMSKIDRSASNVAESGWTYLRPCPTPKELAERDRERAEMKAQRDAALKALEPFAEAAECLDVYTFDRFDIWEHPAAVGITHGHLRAASAALRARDSAPAAK
jgi:hypothetical protein